MAEEMESTQKPPDWLLFFTAPIVWLVAEYFAMIWHYREFDLTTYWINGMIMMKLPYLLMLIPAVWVVLLLLRMFWLRGVLRVLCAWLPAYGFPLLALIHGIHGTMRVETEFEEIFGLPLPASASAVKASFMHGAGDSMYQFCFKCSPEFIDALVERNATKLGEWPGDLPPEMMEFGPLPGRIWEISGWPDPAQWGDLALYHYASGNWSVDVLWSKSQSRVYVAAGN